MLVMLAYDVPEQRHQTFLREHFERVGGERVQYSIYLFQGEDHECERVIRYMRRMASGIPGDIRLFPLEESVWEAQIVVASRGPDSPKTESLPQFVEIW
jgi:CRISPR-associated endonuclease Cas2